MNAVQDTDEVDNRLVTDNVITLSRLPCQLIDLTIHVLESFTSNVYVWVFDVGAVTEENLVGRIPRLPPGKIAIGATAGWKPSTKWTPFVSGVTIAFSSSDEVFTPLQGEDPIPVGWVFYHARKGNPS